MQKEESRFGASTILEGMVSIRALLSGRRDGINDRKIERILYDRERYAKIKKEIGYLTHEGERQGFTVEGIDTETFAEMTVGNTHGGLLAVCGERSLPCLSESAAEILPNGFYVMIDGIEDPYNFGYALRSMYALGVSGIVLPERNWLSAAGVVARASAGASELFPTFVTENAEQAHAFFRSIGYRTVAADADTEVSLDNARLTYPVFLLVGGEKRGLSNRLLSSVNEVVKIPYGRDFSAALSAASAATILAYEIARQNRF